MSWSLEISGGDLSYGGTGLNTVTGGSKLVQDLSCCLLEPMGDDSMHPDYGSLINGGTDPSGNVYQGLIGGPNDSSASTLVSSEIQRICQTYQQYQVARNNSDLNTYGTSTLSLGEALLAVNNISLTTLETAMNVNVSLNTGSGSAQLNTTMDT